MIYSVLQLYYVITYVKNFIILIIFNSFPFSPAPTHVIKLQPQSIQPEPIQWELVHLSPPLLNQSY